MCGMFDTETLVVWKHYAVPKSLLANHHLPNENCSFCLPLTEKNFISYVDYISSHPHDMFWILCIQYIYYDLSPHESSKFQSIQWLGSEGAMAAMGIGGSRRGSE